MVFPLIAAGLEALSAYGVGSTVAGLADDIPAIASMIMKHGESQDEPPEIQAQREQQIVAQRDKLVAKLVQGGMPPEQATKQVNDQLAPALQDAKQRSEGDAGAQSDGPGWGNVIGAAAGLLPGLGALRGGLGAAKAAYGAAAAAPAALGKVGQIAKGLGAGQWSLMKSGVMGAPNPDKLPGASTPWMAPGSASDWAPPGASSGWAPPGASSPMPGSSSPWMAPGSSSPIDMASQTALARLSQGRAPMAPPNAGGQMEQTGRAPGPNFTMAPAERGRGLPYSPPQADPRQEELMRMMALAHLSPEQLNRG